MLTIVTIQVKQLWDVGILPSEVPQLAANSTSCSIARYCTCLVCDLIQMICTTHTQLDSTQTIAGPSSLHLKEICQNFFSWAAALVLVARTCKPHVPNWSSMTNGLSGTTNGPILSGNCSQGDTTVLGCECMGWATNDLPMN